MNLIWGMMNDLSFIISLGMISIPIPGIASPIQSLLSTIIYMDLLITDKWLTPLLDKAKQTSEEEDDDDEDMPMNLFIGSQGFQSRLLLFNLGSTLVFLIIQVMLLLTTGLMRLVSPINLRAKQFYQFLERKFIWGGTIRFVIQQFQPLIFSSLINIRSISFSENKSQSQDKMANFYLSTIIFAGMLISIIIFTVIIKQGIAGEEKFSTLIEGLNDSKQGFSQYWTVWTLAKWSLMCFVLILLIDYPCQQLQLLTILSMFSAILQFRVRPMNTNLENAICFFNEVMTTFYLYALIGLAAAGEDITLRENLGLALISILLFTILVNILKVLIMIIFEIVMKIRRRVNAQRDKKVLLLRKRKRVYRYGTVRLQSLHQRGQIEERKEVLEKKLELHNSQ
ncbi:hypothetical protein FGO68_gene670 [Halteria grandinella]|uniref:TRP C-terminal domain-containing protein n=1 Tax=Halteria grandinella TaxID=5974 RepID=A0A8J8P5Y7_HALGN|nr:hypothetical protein FGO68_gene670 [Halteria grandinella]